MHRRRCHAVVFNKDNRPIAKNVAPLKPPGFATEARKAAHRVDKWANYIQRLRASAITKGMFKEVVFAIEGPWNDGHDDCDVLVGELAMQEKKLWVEQGSSNRLYWAYRQRNRPNTDAVRHKVRD